MEERRSYPRVGLEIEVNLSSDSHFFAGLAGDISAGGIFVSTYRTLVVGQRLTLELALPNGSVNASGVVKWLRPGNEAMSPGAGIAFDEVSDEARARIREFCAERPPLYYDVDAKSRKSIG